MKESFKRLTALFFAAATAAAVSVSASADSVVLADIESIPEISSVCIDRIPDLKIEIAHSDTARAAAPAEFDIDSIPDLENVIVISEIPELTTTWNMQNVKLNTFCAANNDSSDTPESSDDTDTDLTIRFSGDVDYDNEITSADALAALRISAEVTEASNDEIEAADVDLDGTVTSSDALCILRNSAGLSD